MIFIFKLKLLFMEKPSRQLIFHTKYLQCIGQMVLKSNHEYVPEEDKQNYYNRRLLFYKRYTNSNKNFTRYRITT